MTLSFSDLEQYKQYGFPQTYPANIRSFYSPVDDVHGALKTVVSSCSHSLIIAMYGYDDEELHKIVLAKCSDPTIFVSLALDSSQAGGIHEKALLAEGDTLGTHVVTGRSEKGAIMHLKAVVVDGLWVIGGSTNWSIGGETKQDNEMTIIMDATHAAELSSRILIIHDAMSGKSEVAA